MTLRVVSVAVAQEQGGTNVATKLDRWDRQPHLTDVAVRVEERIYKSTPQGTLKLHIWSPKTDRKDRPCIVFFFGGGWHSGTYRQFARQSEYLASRGMVAASAEYRIRKMHNTTPDVCVEDAKSAIRWIRAHAEELGLDVELWLAADQPHGFFNDTPWLEVTTLRLDRYLTRLGYLSGEPTVVLPENSSSLKQDNGEKQ